MQVGDAAGIGIYTGTVNTVENIAFYYNGYALGVLADENGGHWYWDVDENKFKVNDAAGSSWASQIVRGAGLSMDTAAGRTVSSIYWRDVLYKLVPV